MSPSHLVLKITLALCLTLAVTAQPRQQGLPQPGQPVISLDSAQYCIGDSWKFSLSNGVPHTPVRLLGSSNGQSWEITEWGKTDADGNFSEGGTFRAEAVGNHTLKLDLGGTVSDTISFVVSDCSLTGRIALDSAEYCFKDSWKFTLSNGVPHTPVRLLGSSNGQSWEITEWGKTDADGNFREAGTFATAAGLGKHTLKLDVGGTKSNTLSFVVSDCSLTGRIAFVSTRDGEGAAAGHLAVPFIYVANPDGSGVKRLTRGASPAWSKDGKRIAFHSWIGGSINSGLAEIRVINADGYNERVLGPGGVPSWSPDGTKIVYTSVVPEGGIFMMNADGSGVTRLVSNEFANPGWGDYAVEMPSWSPDGGSIAFLRANYEDPWTVHFLDLANSEISLLNIGWSVGGFRPAWSPDGTKLLLQVGTTIASVNRNSSGLHGHLLSGEYGNPDWSPDGRSIVFGSRKRIFVANLENGSVRQLIPDAVAPARPDYWDSDPVWSRVRQ